MNPTGSGAPAIIKSVAVLLLGLSTLTVAAGAVVIGWAMVFGDDAKTGGKPEGRSQEASSDLSQGFEAPSPLEGADEDSSWIHDKLRTEIRELERVSSQFYLAVAAVIVTAASLFALIALPTSAWLSFSEARKIKGRIGLLNTEVETSLGKIRKQSEIFATKNRAMDQKVEHWEHVWDTYSELVLEVVSSLQQSEILSEKESRDLRARLFEASARMDLHHHQPEIVKSALWKLRQVGTMDALPDLDAVKNDPRADAELRLAAQAAIQEIKKREADQNDQPDQGHEAGEPDP